jgi:hypothetical protein
MTEQEIRAIFLLAGYTIRSLHPTLNGYSTSREDPWWLVSTEHGLFHIGWRSHVISIDWSDIGPQPSFTRDDVTKDATMIHAWSLGKAVDYLFDLRHQHLHRIILLKTMAVTEEITQEAQARFEAEIENRPVDEEPSILLWSSRRWDGLFETERAIWLHRVIHDRQKAA